MATYASTTTLDHPRVERISRNLGVVIGQCNLTTYSTTGATITDITKYFVTVKRVISDSVSKNKYPVRWDATDKCFHAFTITDTAGDLTELAGGVDVGEIHFMAIGVLS